MNNIHTRLREAREAAGYASVQEAVDRFGWVYSTYGGHENGARGVTASKVAEYARAFNVTTDWLLHGAGPLPAKSARATDPGFEESQAPFTSDAQPLVQSATAEKSKMSKIAEILAPSVKRPSYFVISRDVSELALYCGDILIIDLACKPTPNAIVLANMVDYETASAYTLVRRYFSPFLVGAANDVNPAITVDNERVSVMGVVVASVRTTKTLPAAVEG